VAAIPRAIFCAGFFNGGERETMSTIDWVKAALFLVALVIWFVWTSRRGWLTSEAKRNDVQEPPSERQLHWDLRHIREDISVLVFVNSLLLWFVVFTIVFGLR
jgi:hypothetical protein